MEFFRQSEDKTMPRPSPGLPVRNPLRKHGATLWFAVAAGVGAALFLTPSASSATQRPVTVAAIAGSATERDGSRDFDFLYGSWDGHYQLLRHPLTGSTEWYKFEGKSVMRGILAFANVDEDILSRPQGTESALTVRLYNKKTHDWSIYFGTDIGGALALPATVGKFDEHGVGHFYDHELFNGKPIVVRYTWTHSTPNAARFQQAFSPDDGKTWETNWIADFTRTPRPSPFR
jgi:hypothetical protein